MIDNDRPLSFPASVRPSSCTCNVLQVGIPNSSQLEFETPRMLPPCMRLHSTFAGLRSDVPYGPLADAESGLVLGLVYGDVRRNS